MSERRRLSHAPCFHPGKAGYVCSICKSLRYPGRIYGLGRFGSKVLYNAKFRSLILLPQNLNFSVSAAAVEDAAPVWLAAPLPPCLTRPVSDILVSLLFRPVGCRSCIGISGRVIFNRATTRGPARRATKMMSMRKYNVAKRMTLRFRSFDCLIE